MAGTVFGMDNYMCLCVQQFDQLGEVGDSGSCSLSGSAAPYQTE